MSKEDYREKIEEHRQSINIEKPNSRQSRSRVAKTKNPKRRDPLMTVLTVIFIFIPLVVLVYVWGFYTPTTPSQAQGNEESVEYAKNDKLKDDEPINDEPGLIDDTVDENKEDDQSEVVKQDSKQKKQNEESKQDDQNEDKPISNEESSTETDDNGQAQDEQTSLDNEKLNNNQHKVKSGDTLYSIADNNNTTVDAIMEANGLDTPDIQVDQILVLP